MKLNLFSGRDTFYSVVASTEEEGSPEEYETREQLLLSALFPFYDESDESQSDQEEKEGRYQESSVQRRLKGDLMRSLARSQFNLKCLEVFILCRSWQRN